MDALSVIPVAALSRVLEDPMAVHLVLSGAKVHPFSQWLRDPGVQGSVKPMKDLDICLVNKDQTVAFVPGAEVIHTSPHYLLSIDLTPFLPDGGLEGYKGPTRVYYPAKAEVPATFLVESDGGVYVVAPLLPPMPMEPHP